MIKTQSPPALLLRTLLLLLGCSTLGCTSLEDYIYPAPHFDTAPRRIVVPETGVTLSYDPKSGTLPIVLAHAEDRPLRALLSTRRARHSIAPSALPKGCMVEGELSLPERKAGEAGEASKIVAVVRDVVRLPRLKVGELVVEGLPMLVEELPEGIDVVLTADAFPNTIVSLDGPRRELRIRLGRLPDLREKGSKSERLDLEMFWGPSAVTASRFLASIQVVAASALDGTLIVGPSRSTVIQTHKGPELLPIGPRGLEPLLEGSRKVRMDNVFGHDFKRSEATIVSELGSGWLVLGAGFLSRHVLHLDLTNRLTRLDVE